MSRKLFVATALAVCLALVFFAAISASDRTRSRDARSTAGPVFRTTADTRDLRDTFDPRFKQPLQVSGIEMIDPSALQGARVSR